MPVRDDKMLAVRQILEYSILWNYKLSGTTNKDKNNSTELKSSFMMFDFPTFW